MSTLLNIDRITGHMTADGFQISPDTQLADLPPSFEIGKKLMAFNGKRETATQFADLHLQEGRFTITLSLRFENDILVRSFIMLSAPEHEILSDDDFYIDQSDRYGFHARWLKKQLGKTQFAQYVFSWGAAGVARDKSENVFIYLNNNNEM